MATYSNTNISVLNLAVYAGDRNKTDLTFTAGGSVWDMTGVTLTAQIRAKPTSSLAAIEATFTEIDAAQGQWRMEWDGDTIRNLLGAREEWIGVWDLQVQEPGATGPDTLIRGTVRALMDVTR